MHISRNQGAVLTLSAALLALSACGGGGGSTPASLQQPLSTQSMPGLRTSDSIVPGAVDPRALGLPAGFRGAVLPGGYRGPDWLSADAGKPGIKVYVSDYAASAIEIYKPTGGAPIGAIKTGISSPLGTWVTSTGTLYVCNSASNTVTVYPLGKTKPSLTLTGMTFPISVAVSKTGEAYVSSFSTNTVYVFKSGATKPSKSLSLSYPEGIAIDTAQNAYVAHDDANFNGVVEKYGPGGVGGTDLGIVSGAAGDTRLAVSGDLLLGDQTNDVVNVYKPGGTKPVSTINVAGHNAYKFALNSTESDLYVADPNNGVVAVYSYPKGVAQKTTFTGLSSVYGVALSPAAPF